MFRSTGLVLIALAIATPSPALAKLKRCPDGKLRVVCATRTVPGSNNPWFIPAPPDYKTRTEFFRAVERQSAIAKTAHQTGKLSDADFAAIKQKLNQARSQR